MMQHIKKSHPYSVIKALHASSATVSGAPLGRPTGLDDHILVNHDPGEKNICLSISGADAIERVHQASHDYDGSFHSSVVGL